MFDMSLKALSDKKKMMDRGNLVAEEDVMTKLPAIKTDKILHFYQRGEMYSESQIFAGWSKLEKLFATSWSEVSPFVTSLSQL